MAGNFVAAGGGGAAIAVISNAIKACGSIVTIDGTAFQTLLSVMEEPLVVRAEGGFFTRRYRYITGFRGLTFYTQVKQPLQIPDHVAIINAEKITIPDF